MSPSSTGLYAHLQWIDAGGVDTQQVLSNLEAGGPLDRDRDRQHALRNASTPCLVEVKNWTNVGSRRTPGADTVDA